MQESDLSERIRKQIGVLPPTMRRVAQYMERNRVEVVALSAAELGEVLGTSDATIIRTAKALGYAGLAELRRQLTRDLSAGTPVENFRRTLDATRADARKAMTRSLKMTQDVLASLGAPEMLDRIERMVHRLDEAQRIVVFGIGPTAYISGYAAHMLRRMGRKVLLLDRTGRDLADQMLELTSGDALLLISYSHPYAEVLAVVEDALIQALPILLITNDADSPLVRKSQEYLVLPRGGVHGMALNAATFACVEELVVGLSVRLPENADASLQRLERLRASLDRQS